MFRMILNSIGRTSSQSTKLAFVGRLEPGAKGCDLLLQTLALDKWRGRRLTVAFFGKGKNELGVRWLADRLNLRKCDLRRLCG